MDSVTELLLSLGIHSTYKGFRYLRYVLCLCLEQEDSLYSSRKIIYGDTGSHFHTSSDSVEHCIRTVISFCWHHGNRELLCSIARYPLMHKPTNSEFLDILYYHLKG